jgi:signal transduction histidine kinase
MLQETFKHRSGRVISLGRLALACVFLLGVWLDPTQPSRAPGVGYLILALYVVFSGVQLGLTWNSWWLESRLAAPAHVIDIGVFSVMVFLSEGYTSPFFTFFVFLLLSATIRWGWRETALTALGVITLFFLAGLAALEYGEAEFDVQRLIFRSAYLVVLSLILIWFGVNQKAKARQMPRMELEGSSGPAQLPIQHALEYALQRTGGEHALFAWWEQEEPWTNVSTLVDGEVRTRRFAPGEYDELVDPALANKAFIFDRSRGRVVSDRPSRATKLGDALHPRFAEEMGLTSGLVLPVQTEEFGGLVIVSGVPGLCSDDLAVAESVSQEISAALQRMSLFRMSEDSAVVRTRLSLARDLHDSVVQLLAGTSFRLEAIRKAAGAGRDIGADVQALQTELAQEQRDLRTFILKLRNDPEVRGRTDLRTGLSVLAERMSRQWGIECLVEGGSASLEVPARLEHDVHQLVREGVANAVRHGQATEVKLHLNGGDQLVRLDIADNGSGFAVPPGAADGEETAEAVRPWSLRERVRELGGKLHLSSASTGSRVSITLPVELRD